MAEMRFPGGYTFNPETGELQGAGIPRSRGTSSRPSTRTNTSSRSYTSYPYGRSSGLSLWDRMNNFVINIGNWIATNGEQAMSYLAMGCLGLAWLGFAIGIISIWIEEGFLWALIAGIFGGGIFYMISGIALAVFYFIDDFILLIVRYIFYNIYTLLVALALFVAPVVVDAVSSLDFGSDRRSSQVEEPASYRTPNIYVCTATSSLNIRSAPRTDAYVIGSLKPGQEVDVFNFVDGFAKITYNSQPAYVSSTYLRKK